MGLFSGWRKKTGDDKPPSSHTLPDFVRGIQHAVNMATLMYEQNAEAFLDRHLKDDGSPNVQVVKIPNSKYVLVVPTMAASRPPDMILDEMEVKMCVRIDKTETKPGHPAGDKDVTRASFHCSLASGDQKVKGSNEIDLVMKFKRGDPPEGVSRIIENFVNSITPREPDPPTTTPAVPTSPTA